MKNKIPYSFIPFNILKNISSVFLGLGSKIEKSLPSLKLNLEYVKLGINAQEYTAMCLMSSLFSFILLNIIINIFFIIINFGRSLLLAFGISTAMSLFIFAQQILYPKIHVQRKTKDIERNLLPALQDILVQLNSGIPFFRIIVNISGKNYGEISKEFSKAINKINAGYSQIDVLDEMASKSTSLYFRRALWQLVNGIKTGSDTITVIKEIISSLSEEQLIQIQRYSGQLNPLIMFYMIVTIILPSLGMTFLIVISSFLSAQEFVTKIIFWGLYGMVLFFQIMFMGIIKVRRPTLLED